MKEQLEKVMEHMADSMWEDRYESNLRGVTINSAQKKLHQTTSFTMRHMLIVYLMLLTVVVGYATFIFLDFTDLRSDLPTYARM